MSRALPRITALAATALAIFAIAAFAWLAGGGGVADAAGTSDDGSAPSSQTLPIQSQDRDRDGKPCPKGEGGGSEQQAPESSATPSTEL